MSQRRTSIWVNAVAGGVLLGSSWLGQAQANTIVFVDNFNNGVVANSNTISSF